jgi:hypothetical protein
METHTQERGFRGSDSCTQCERYALAIPRQIGDRVGLRCDARQELSQRTDTWSIIDFVNPIDARLDSNVSEARR